MYKIIKVTDHGGNIKLEFMESLKSEHPEMNGYFLYPLHTATRLCFIWADKSDKMMRTTLVKEYKEDNKVLKIKTENSIYTLEKINKDGGICQNTDSR